MGSHVMPAVSPMSGCPTFDTDKKKTRNEPNLKFRYPTGRRSNNYARHEYTDILPLPPPPPPPPPRINEPGTPVFGTKENQELDVLEFSNTPELHHNIEN